MDDSGFVPDLQEITYMPRNSKWIPLDKKETESPVDSPHISTEESRRPLKAELLTWCKLHHLARLRIRKTLMKAYKKQFVQIELKDKKIIFMQAKRTVGN